jgi:hypothetical protein
VEAVELAVSVETRGGKEGEGEGEGRRGGERRGLYDKGGDARSRTNIATEAIKLPLCQQDYSTIGSNQIALEAAFAVQESEVQLVRLLR